MPEYNRPHQRPEIYHRLLTHLIHDNILRIFCHAHGTHLSVSALTVPPALFICHIGKSLKQTNISYVTGSANYDQHRTQRKKEIGKIIEHSERCLSPSRTIAKTIAIVVTRTSSIFRVFLLKASYICLLVI